MADQPQKQRHERFQVHLAVRYAVAKDFVVEYAENLSQGGLFLVGAHQMAPRTEVLVELDLPGYGQFQVVAEVAHILPPDQAAILGRKPGAGLQIMKGPPDFFEKLTDYLQRLGRRRDALVLCSNAAYAAAFARAGYQSEVLPPVSDFRRALMHIDGTIAGVVVGSDEVAAYAEVARGVGAAELVFAVDSEAELDRALTRLDEML